MTFRPHALHLKAELFVKSSRVHVRDDGFTRCNFHLKFFIMVYRGIDISKSSFVAAYPSTNGNPTKTFPNTTAGMRELIGTLAVAEHHCVMEATSNYGCCCTCYIRTVLPQFCPPPKKKQIKHFSRMMMPVTKTDEKDAYMIAMYGEKMNPPIYKMPSQATIRILTTEGFTYFDNAKQLSRFIGICPTYQQSRTSVNIREHINRNDDERLRSLLYIAFWTALRYNSRECYIRLKANEKPFKVALIAVTNKLVRPVLTITTINSIYRWICPG